MITEVHFPALEGYGWGYEKFNRRAEDWAMVGVCALVKEAGEGVRGRAHRPDQHGLDAAARHRRRGRRCAADRSTRRIAAAAEQAAEGTEPPADLNATPDYKRHLARV